jgi:hypothetical protein
MKKKLIPLVVVLAETLTQVWQKALLTEPWFLAEKQWFVRRSVDLGSVEIGLHSWS